PPPSLPTRRSSDLTLQLAAPGGELLQADALPLPLPVALSDQRRHIPHPRRAVSRVHHHQIHGDGTDDRTTPAVFPQQDRAAPREPHRAPYAVAVPAAARPHA